MTEAEDLNYDCNYNMFLARTMLANLTSLADRQKAVKWMRKLAKCNRTTEEMKLRNDFMYHLALNVQNGQLKNPFTDDPPTDEKLPSLLKLLPGVSEAEPSRQPGSQAGTPRVTKPHQKKPLLYEYSPDGGAFLAAQPVPKCGAFCYLAVVSRGKSKE